MEHVSERESESNQASETILHWLVECPEMDALASAEISAHASPFATFCSPKLAVKNCSFWPAQPLRAAMSDIHAFHPVASAWKSGNRSSQEPE